MRVLLFFLLAPCVIAAQVGVNTNQPQQYFHIDGGKDNTQNPPTSTMINNDVVVNNNAKMGIGVLVPNAGVEISSQAQAMGFRLVDGTQSDGRLLMSIDTSGDTKWQARLQTQIVSSDGGSFNGVVSSDMTYINRKVSLAPGRWMINTNLLLATNTNGSKSKGFYARFSWAEQSGSSYVLSPDAIYGNEIGGPYMYSYGVAKGNTIIQNNSGVTKTYYLVTKSPTFWGGYPTSSTWRSLGHSFWGETSIIAFPAN